MSILQPKRLKHAKRFRGRLKGMTKGGSELSFGSFGLKSMGSRWVTARQIESCRRSILRYLKKGGKLWIRIFPDKPITSKGVEFPLGGGKGPVDHYVCVVKSGRVLFELDGVAEEVAKEALTTAGDKLPVKTKFIKK